MRRFLILTFLLLSGCNAADTANTARDEAKSSWNTLGEIAGTHPKPPEKRQDAQERYCYRAYHDIICYGAPLKGEEYRLVGFQEKNGQTGYVLPSALLDGGANLPPLQSVTIGLPPRVASQASGQGGRHLEEIKVDPMELEPKLLIPVKAE
jgi:hypothetical protein